MREIVRRLTDFHNQKLNSIPVIYRNNNVKVYRHPPNTPQKWLSASNSYIYSFFVQTYTLTYLIRSETVFTCVSIILCRFWSARNTESGKRWVLKWESMATFAWIDIVLIHSRSSVEHVKTITETTPLKYSPSKMSPSLFKDYSKLLFGK